VAWRGDSPPAAAFELIDTVRGAGPRIAARGHPAKVYGRMSETWSSFSRRILHWLRRTPVATFILCPLAVLAFELALHRGRPALVRLEKIFAAEYTAYRM
jgi:hypothetical protein